MNPSRDEAQAIRARVASVEAPPNPEAHLWHLFSTAATPEAFCRAWLALQCARIAGVSDGVVVLQKPDSESFAPAAFWPETQARRTLLAEVTERAMRAGQGVVLPRSSRAGTAQLARYHVAYPIRLDGDVRGVVAIEIEVKKDAELDAAVAELQWGAGWLEVLLRRGHGDPDTVTRTRLAFVVTLFAAILDQSDFARGASACVTELSTFLDCDRVSLGVVKGHQIRIAALSHSAHFDAHSNLARAIESAMRESVDQRATLSYPAPEATEKVRAPNITQAHAHLAHAFDSATIVSIPLPARDRIVGGLTLERSTLRPFEAPALALIESVAALLGPLIELHLASEEPLTQQVKKRADQWWAKLVGPAHGGLKLAAIAGALFAAVLIFGKGEFRVTSETVIEGSIQRVVTAPFSGFVREVNIRPGDTVRAGDVLAQLDDRDLKLEQLKDQAVRDERSNQVREAMAGHDRAQASIASAQLAQSEAQLGLLNEQLSRTQLTAPFDGVVVRGDLSHSLGEPVERGQVLFEVAPLNSYRVVLQVDERDIGAIAVGQHGDLTLAAMPDQRIGFTVAKITPVNIAREGRNYFRVEARLNQDEARLRPGMEGVAKVSIGREHLAWIWTRELANWLRVALWSALP